MADDITVPGTGTVLATDDDGTRHWPWEKLAWGPDGTFNKVDTATGKPLPIQVRSTTGLIPIGEPTDAKSTATDTTSVTLISISKQISASAQLTVTGLDTINTSVVNGTGPVGAGTAAAAQRTTLASDDPAVVALQVIDDWDETNRAAVNIIAGQVAITAGAGAVAANTPRFTHASDDPVTTSLQIMDDWDESDRAKVNLISGQTSGVAGNAGAASVATLRVVVATDSPDVATLGAVAGAAVITDANGTIQQYLRGLVKRWVDALGAGTSAAALRTTTASDSPVIAVYGGVTETAPATDTASSGLNGRLQRIAQRLTTLLVPGAGTAATALRTTLASDDPAVAALQIMDNPGLSATVSQTRPSNTNTYAAGDVLGPTGGGTASMNFALGAVSGSNILITAISLRRDVAALISGETSYVMHFFDVTQPGAQADEATFTLASGDRTAYLGNINIGTPVDLGATLYVKTTGVNFPAKLAGTGIFGVLVTTGGYVAASASVLSVTIDAVQL